MNWRPGSRRAGSSGRLIVWLALVALVAIALVGGACSGGSSGSGGSGGGISVRGSEYKLEPATVTVPSGKPVTITFENVGTIAHDWKAEGVPGAEVAETPPKGKKSVTFTPTTPGTYRVLCTLPGHAEAGMVGQLVVQ